ncbi:CheR family methyltransferase, partial [Porticoccus sp.]
LTSGETYFFRDSGQHRLLQEKILPELLERREPERSLRIWSAACSSGEEAYSLAILLDELLADQSQWNILILATDINRESILKAQRGIYTEWSFRGMSAARRERYFHRQKDSWVLDDSIRRRVRFQSGDLVADVIPGTEGEVHDMDLILCRNVFIYMPPHVVTTIADKLTATLTTGGFLVTGHGELYTHHLGQLRARVFPESVIYQKVVEPFLAQSPAVPVTALRCRPARRLQEQSAAAPVTTPRSVTAKRAATPPAGRNAGAEAPAAQKLAVESDQPRGDSDILLAWQYANRGQPERAAEVCSAMVARNPLDPDPHYLMALLAQEREEFAAAKELLKKAIYLDHSFIGAYLDLGDLYTREGDGARATRMRATARDLLRGLPGNELVRLYGSSTAADVLHYVENLLSSSRP